MNLSSIFIERPIMTTLLMATIFCIGMFTYFQLPVANLPDVDFPTINVTASFPGASPETMANTVASPLEKQFMAIQGVKKVTSSNTLGQTTITIEFDINKTIDSAALDVQTAIATASPNLPPNLPAPPTLQKVNPSDSPIIYVAVTSDTLTLGEIYTYAFTFIAQRLSIIEGVAQVQVYGAPFAVRVQVDPGLIANLGITLPEIANSLITGSPNLPSGELDNATRTSLIISEGQLNKASEFNPLVVRYQDGAPVRIEDIGEAIDSIQNIRYQLKYYTENNEVKNGVVMSVRRQPGANTVAVADKVREALPQITSLLPDSLDVTVVYDRSLPIRESLFDVKLTLLLALVLVILVIFFYLGKVTDTLIPSLAMPLSIVLTFIVMYFCGFTIDNLSLLALTLATGFIVDDAIVVLENIVRRVEKGEDTWTASYEGSKQISFTILSMTLSLAAVFIPLVFMSGLIGKIFFEFSVVLMVVVLASGFISLSLTPMLASQLVGTRDKDNKTKTEVLSEKLNNWLLRHYDSALKKVLNYKPLVLAVGLICVLLSLFFFWHLPKDFIPDDDIGFVIAYTQAGEGTSPELMFTLQDKVMDVIRKSPYVSSLVSVAGNPQIRMGVGFVAMVPYKDRVQSSQVIQSLYQSLNQIPGINVFFKNIPLINLSVGSQVRGSFQYAMTSLDPDALTESASKFIEKMQSNPKFIGVIADLEVNTPELKIEILRDEASSYGVTAQDIENALLLAYSGGRVTKIDTPFDQYDVILELKPEFALTPDNLNQIYVRSQTKGLVPLSAVARWKESVGPASVNHISQLPAVTVSYSLRPDVPLSEALADLSAIANETLAGNVTGVSIGAGQSFEEAVKSSGFLFLLALFAIYVILGILYESFIHPLTIISTLAPAIMGGLLTLWLMGYPLSLYAYLGLILLLGIVKKNGILVVDFAIENRRTMGVSAEKAIYESCMVRFRPIMMTTFAAMMGALPIALGWGASAESRRPLGFVIIGGLVVSQLITLFLTPVVYLYLDKWNERFTIKGQKQT